MSDIYIYIYIYSPRLLHLEKPSYWSSGSRKLSVLGLGFRAVVRDLRFSLCPSSSSTSLPSICVVAGFWDTSHAYGFCRGLPLYVHIYIYTHIYIYICTRYIRASSSHPAHCCRRLVESMNLLLIPFIWFASSINGFSLLITIPMVSAGLASKKSYRYLCCERAFASRANASDRADEQADRCDHRLGCPSSGLSEITQNW